MVFLAERDLPREQGKYRLIKILSYNFYLRNRSVFVSIHIDVQWVNGKILFPTVAEVARERFAMAITARNLSK